MPVQVGEILVRVHMAAGTLASALSDLAAAGQPALRAWIGHFDDACRVKWDDRATPSKRWRALCVEPAQPRLDASRATLDAATAEQAHLLVLPELSLDLPMREALTQALEATTAGHSPLLCVPGSFHEFVAGRWLNTAPLLDGITGEALFTHCKLRVFGNVGEGDEPDVAEAIEVGNEFHVLASAAGCFGVLICKDHLDLHHSVRTLIQQVPVDWLLVPSYGDEKTVQGHRRRAHELAHTEVGCQVIVANIRNLGIGTASEPLPGFGLGPWDASAQDVGPGGGLVRFPFHRPTPLTPDTAHPSTAKLPHSPFALPSRGLKRVK